MNATSRGGASTTAVFLLFLHAAVFLVIAAACYAAPRRVFGESAWLPLPGLAVALLAAATLALAIVLIAVAREGLRRQVRLALLGVFVFDLQVPFFLGLFPAFFEHLEVNLGLPWFLLLAVFCLLVGGTVYGLLVTRGEPDRPAAVG